MNDTKPSQIKEKLKAGKLNRRFFTERYNIAPTQNISGVLESDGDRIAEESR